MQMLRSYLFLIWLYGWMAIVGVLYLPTLLMPRVVTLKAIGFYGEIILFGLRWICGIRTEIRGREHVVPGPAIYAGKHHCMLDVFIPFITTLRRVRQFPAEDGAPLEVETVARFNTGQGWSLDNFEGLTQQRGRRILMVSDDKIGRDDRSVFALLRVTAPTAQ